MKTILYLARSQTLHSLSIKCLRTKACKRAIKSKNLPKNK